MSFLSLFPILRVGILRASIAFSLIAGPAIVMTTSGCGDGNARYTLSQAKATITPENHVAVDVLYVNDGDERYEGSRCIVVEWQTGAVQSREDVRAGKAPAGAIVIVDTVRWCIGGNNSLDDGKSDSFHVVSGQVQSTLAGSIIVVAGEQYKGTANDDRLLLASP